MNFVELVAHELEMVQALDIAFVMLVVGGVAWTVNAWNFIRAEIESRGGLI